jgi:DNA primase
MSSTVEKIKDRLNIVDVVSSYIKLEKAGKNFKANCPFHNEKTPSFFVSPDRGSYHCFGCQVGGDIFSFVEMFEGTDFFGALQILADRAGVVIEKKDLQKSDDKNNLYSIMEKATIYFQNNLSKETKVIEYLEKRGISKQSIKFFRIGFAPKGWQGLVDSFKDVVQEDLLKVGLVKKSEKTDGFYDTFRSRIMFPIFDTAGRVIAFSGRIFEGDDKEAKYLNSPDSILFNKSRILYGYFQARDSIRKNNFAVLVEGQTDLIMSHQAGFRNTVATSGTALTIDHLNLIKRMTSNLVLAFDQDKAGISSMSKGAIEAIRLGFDVKIVSLPEGADPAEIILESPEKWREAIRNSKHVIDFHINLLQRQNFDNRKFKLEVGKVALPYIKVIQNSIDQNHFISQIANLLNVTEESIAEELDKIDIEVSSENIETNTNLRSESFSRKEQIHRKLSGFVLWQKSGEMVDLIQKRFKEISSKDILETIEKDNSLSFEAELYFANSSNLKNSIEEMLNALEKEYINKKLNDILLKVRETESKGGDVTELLTQFSNLSKKKEQFQSSID